MDTPIRLQRVRVEGYKRLRQIDVQLRPLNVLIGANGAGKSSFLDLFDLIARSARQELAAALAKRGGIARVISFDAPPRLFIELETTPIEWPDDSTHKSPFKYELELHSKPLGYQFLRENFVQQRDTPEPFRYIQRSQTTLKFYDPKLKGLSDYEEPFARDETALSQAPRMFPAADNFRRRLAATCHMAPIPLGERAPVMVPQTLIPDASVPGADGSNLLSALYLLRTAHEDVYERLEDFLKSGFPDFKKLEFPPAGAGQIMLAWHENGLAPSYAPELSAGTLRFIHLAALLLSPQPPPLILLDEPEMSFHPELIRLLSELLKDAALRTQIIVATHSPLLLRWLDPADVMIVDRIDGNTTVTSAGNIDLAGWLKDYSLDALWDMNVLGGRP